MHDAISIETIATWIPRWHQRLFRLARAVVASDGEATSVVHAAYLKLITHLRAGSREGEVARRLDEFVFFGAMRERVRFRGQMLRLLDAAAGSEPSVENEIASPDGKGARDGRAGCGAPDKQGDAIADSLSDMLRVVFVMIDVIGMAPAEVANMLHVQEATVDSRVQRARAVVRGLMKDQGVNELPEIYAVNESQCRAAVAFLRARVMASKQRVPASV
jgi:DNA-directed RNA polymerase specialized sigma24 family protein